MKVGRGNCPLFRERVVQPGVDVHRLPCLFQMEYGYALKWSMGMQCPSCPRHMPRIGFRYRPVRLLSQCAISSGVPAATMSPPLCPPSGPRSMTWSAHLMTSRLCSMTRTEWPLLISASKAERRRLMSWK